MPVVVADTAGLRETDDLVETIGIEKGIDALVPDLLNPVGICCSSSCN